MNYYFLAASLPTLSLDREPPLSVDAFRELCREQFSARDLAELDAVLAGLERETGGSFMREWRARETALRNALARARADKLSVEAAPYLQPTDRFDAAAEKAAAEAMGRRNPREREAFLDRFRWTCIDEMAGFNPFALPALLAYALKLRITQRWSTLDAETGRRRAETLINQDPESKHADSAAGESDPET